MRADFSLLSASRLISTIGDQFYVVALGVAVYDRTGSSVATVAILTIRGLVHALGMFVYRSASVRQQRRIAVGGDAIRVLLVLAMVPALTHSLAAVYALIALAEAVQLYYSPARIVLVDCCTADRPRAHKLDQIVTTVALTAGLALSGITYETWGVTAALAVDSASFAVSALLLWFATRDLPDRDAPTRDERPRGSTLRWVLGRPAGPGRAAVLLTPLAYLPIDAFNGLLVVWALTRLGGAGTYSFLEAAMAVGLLAGSLLSARLRSPATLGLELVLMGAAYSAAALWGSFAPAAGLLALSAAANMVFAMRQRLLVTQTFTSPEDMGRAWQFYRSASTVVGAIGATAVAAVADATSVTATLTASGVLLAAVGLLLRSRTRPPTPAVPVMERSRTGAA